MDIVTELSRSFLLEDSEINISASIGIDTFAANTESPLLLVRNADIAMYCVKKNGGNWIVVFADIDSAKGPAKLTLVEKMHNALKQEEFEKWVVNYQQLLLSKQRVTFNHAA